MALYYVGDNYVSDPTLGLIFLVTIPTLGFGGKNR